MQKIYFTILLALCGFAGKAQISGPDTVCLGGQINFTTNYAAARTYTWGPDTVNIQPSKMNISSVLTKAADFKGLRGISMQYDGGNYYGFLVNYEGELLRLDFGSSPTLTPAVKPLGDLNGVLDDSCAGIDIVMDGGAWHGFMVSNNRLIHINFGNTLGNNSPTATSTKYASILTNAYQVTLKKVGSEWYGFATNRLFSNITRFEFGTSLSNAPTTTNIGTYPTLNSPTGFALYNDGGSWYMLVNNTGNDNVTRYSFGADITNNNPTGVSLGNPSNMLSNPRAINIFADANELYALVTCENSKVIKMSFPGGIDKAAVGQDLGKFGINGRIGYTSPIWFNNTMYLYGSSYGDTVLYRYNTVYSMPAGSQTFYSNNSYTRTATKAGKQTITLHCDQGLNYGPRAFSKDFFVVDQVRIALKQYGNRMVATGTKCASYVWKLNNVVIPNATTDTLDATENGIYSVTGTIAGCSDLSTYQFFAVGVENVTGNNAMNIYPNPATGLVNINIEGINTAKAIINCYNLLGALVATKQVETTNNNLSATIDLSGMAKGAYYIKVQTAEGATLSKQVMLQ